MCGITGIFSHQLSSTEMQSQTYAMLNQIQHRGPDGWGRYTGTNIALGHVRLSIIDQSGGGQPMANERFVVSYNGEIFNYIELKQELEKRGHVFRSQSDTEVVLKSFEEYGVSAFEKFNGQFAILIWDKFKQRLYAVRDRFGIRPLYVLDQLTSTYFSSEMKSFDVLPEFERNYHFQHLYEHALLWNTLGTDTVYQNIRTIKQGCYEVYENGKCIQTKQYYELGSSKQEFSGRYEEAKEQLHFLLSDAVKLRLRSDTEVGCYLSGGVDSSIIAHLTDQQRQSSLKTFSVSFDDAQYDESHYQGLIAKQLNTQHSDVRINNEIINRHFLDTINHSERPVFRTAPAPLSLLSKKVRDSNIKVVLTGEAADEVLFGYDSFKEVKLLSFWSKFPDSQFRPQLIKRLYPHLAHYADDKKFGLMKMYYEGFLKSKTGITGLDIRIHNNKAISNFLSPEVKAQISHDRFLSKIEQSLPDNYAHWSSGQRQQFMEMNTLLSGYLLSSQGDRMSMSHSVEGRYPFLDHRLVEFAFSLPDSFKLKGFSQKHILRDTFKDSIPTQITNRPKLPYQAPDLKAFINNGQLYGMAAELLSNELIEDYGLYDLKKVNRLLHKYRNRTAEQIGYRDNMTLVFMLSSHAALYSSRNRIIDPLDPRLCDVDINEVHQKHHQQGMKNERNY